MNKFYLKRQDLQEDLVKLFLRLNGYFTTGLIIHSPLYGNNQTEIDVVAIRFPHHNQEDRIVECSEFLQIPKDTIDIIIGEVKSSKILFNEALRENKNSIEKLINWIGAFDSEEVSQIKEILHEEMKPKINNNSDIFKKIVFRGKSGNYSIRPIIFSLNIPQPQKGQERFINGQIILDFIWSCFRPDVHRESCSEKYNFNNWGYSLLPIIEYFKNKNKLSVGDINDLYRHFDI
jgi:hypothetical protein